MEAPNTNGEVKTQENTQENDVELSLAYDETYFDDTEVFKINGKAVPWKELKEVYKSQGLPKIATKPNETKGNGGEASANDVNTSKNVNEVKGPNGNEAQALQALELKISNSRNLYKLTKGVEVSRKDIIEAINERAKTDKNMTLDVVDEIIEEKINKIQADKLEAENKIVDELKKQPHPISQNGKGNFIEQSNDAKKLDITSPLSTMADFKKFKDAKKGG